MSDPYALAKIVADAFEGKATGGEEMILNPIYLRLAEDQAETRIRLASNRKEAETLLAQNATLRIELQELGKELAEANAVQNKLDLRVTRFRNAYEPAIAELDRLQEIEPNLANISGIDGTSVKPGIALGLLGEWRISDHLYLQPELLPFYQLGAKDLPLRELQPFWRLKSSSQK